MLSLIAASGAHASHLFCMSGTLAIAVQFSELVQWSTKLEWCLLFSSDGDE